MSSSGARIGLAVGFTALAVAVLVAWNHPAGAYEASIYTATPEAFWIAIGLALAIALSVTLLERGLEQALGIVLGTAAIFAVASLDVIRNYRYSGMGDSMTHLGWLNEIAAGIMSPFDLFYPSMHSIALAFSLASGVSLERAVLVVVPLLFLPFLVFVPLVVRAITGRRLATGFAAIVAWMVLPINNVAAFLGAHPSTLAIFFTPVVLFALVAYLRRDADVESLPLGVSPFGLLLVVAGLGMLFVHPQQFVNVVLVLAVVAGTQFVLRRRGYSHPIVNHRSVYGYTALFATAFLAWTVGQPRFRSAFENFVDGLFSADVGGSTEVGQRGGSLIEIGGSVEEAFARFFLVAAVMGLIAAATVFLTWRGRTSDDAETRSFVGYFALALVPLGGLFVAYFGGTGTMAFRQLGFIYVLVSILAAIGLAGIARSAEVRWSRSLSTSAIAVFLAACLVLSIVTMFASPFVYDPTQHVTDRHIAGYEDSFELGDDRPYAGMGFPVVRYSDALYGVEQSRTMSLTGPSDGELNPTAFRSLDFRDAFVEGEYYFVVTQWDVDRELEVYNELHYSHEALNSTDVHPGVNKVLSNDEFTLYEITARAQGY